MFAVDDGDDDEGDDIEGVEDEQKTKKADNGKVQQR